MALLNVARHQSAFRRLLPIVGLRVPRKHPGPQDPRAVAAVRPDETSRLEHEVRPFTKLDAGLQWACGDYRNWTAELKKSSPPAASAKASQTLVAIKLRQWNDDLFEFG